MEKVFALLLIVFLVSCSNVESVQMVQAEADKDVEMSNNVSVKEKTNTENASDDFVKVYIDMYNFGFTVDNKKIHAGDKVKLIVSSSEGSHGIKFPSLDLSTPKVEEGEEVELEFTAEGGTFDFFCNVPCGSGHRSMKGNLTVLP